MRLIIYVVFSILSLNSLGYVNSQTSVGDSVTSVSSTSNYSERIQDVDLSNLGRTPFQQSITVVSIFVKQASISASAPFCNNQSSTRNQQNIFIFQPNKSLFSQSSI